MKTGLLTHLRQKFRPDIKLNKKVFVFIVCLLIAFAAWMQINLSKTTNHFLNVPLEIINIPKSRFGIDNLKGNLLVEVEAKGFSLLKYDPQKVSIEFKKLKKKSGENLYYLLPNSSLKTIGKKMGKDFHVTKINPDTLYFELKER